MSAVSVSATSTWVCTRPEVAMASNSSPNRMSGTCDAVCASARIPEPIWSAKPTTAPASPTR